ncbi:MAG: hypothetical protein WCJ19_05645 [bacterium]
MQEIKINSIDELNNLEIKKKEIEIENEYLGCCSKTDKRLINYLVQFILALIIIIFSIYQIIAKANNPEIYFSLLSSTFSLFIRAPSLTADK